MKKKELFLIGGLIIFGFIFQYFDSGDISFIKGCNVNKNSIRDKSYPHEFTENFTFDLPAKGLEFDNPAGSVEISPAIDGKIKIESVKIVYHKNDSKVEKYKNMVKIEKGINGDKGIIKTGFEGEEFPYSRVRVHFKISVPPATILTVKNRFGDISIDSSGTSVKVDGKFGAVNIKNISSDINVLNRFGKTRISNIKGKIELDLKFSEAEVTGSSSIDCRISHSSLNLSDIRESNSIKIEGAHTKLTFSDINSDLIKIKDSHSRINLSDINAKELLITSRHCNIDTDNLNSDSISIKNSYNSIRMKNLNGSTLNILLSHGNLQLSLSSMFKKIFITNSYSDIKLAIPDGTNPSLSMNTKYGDI
ncbi:MAG: DUF4097 family beta strand repeat protein, partial [Candidatus Aminicenantes bacterium]|nr:DUF4097 family beta strand repeat protein [Candidatus Aminicenantes bacterium]